MRIKFSSVFFATMLAMALAAACPAQQPPAQSPAEKPRPARQAQKAPAETQDKSDLEPATVSPEEAMRRAIASLSTQIDSLNGEVRLLRKATERNSMTIELLLYEERLSKVEEKLDSAIELKADLDSREAELQRRMKNIQQEAMLRGGLRRDEAEAALRSEIQHAIEDTRNRQNLQQQRMAELQAQATRLRERVEALRKKIERGDEKGEKQ
jgi:ATP-dependent Lon protease